MDLIRDLFTRPPYPAANKAEVTRLLAELYEIGKGDDFLAERPGGAFNAQARHNRARAIGQRLNEIGELALMEWTVKQVRRKLGPELAAHLSYAWAEIGRWVP